MAEVVIARARLIAPAVAAPVIVRASIAASAAPVVSAGPDQTPEALTAVTLTGTVVSGAVTSWTWTQTAGPAVALAGTGASRTFVAPAALAGWSGTFLVVGSDGSQSGSDSVVVTVAGHDVWHAFAGWWSPAVPVSL